MHFQTNVLPFLDTCKCSTQQASISFEPLLTSLFFRLAWVLTLMRRTVVYQFWSGKPVLTLFRVEVKRTPSVSSPELLSAHANSCLFFLESALRADGKALFSGLASRQVTIKASCFTLEVFVVSLALACSKGVPQFSLFVIVSVYGCFNSSCRSNFRDIFGQGCSAALSSAAVW